MVPLSIIFFLSSFNLTILQALKDAIVVTTSGAEALPFLASLVVLPASVLFFGYYAKLLSAFPRHRVYYLAIVPFVLFYGIFAGLVYPISDSLHFHGLFDRVCALSYACILQSKRQLEQHDEHDGLNLLQRLLDCLSSHHCITVLAWHSASIPRALFVGLGCSLQRFVALSSL